MYQVGMFELLFMLKLEKIWSLGFRQYDTNCSVANNKNLAAEIKMISEKRN